MRASGTFSIIFFQTLQVKKRLGEFKQRVFAIAMSDSIHGTERLGNTSNDRLVKEFFKEVCFTSFSTSFVFLFCGF